MTTTVGVGELARVDMIVSQGADNQYRFRYSAGTPPVPVNMTGWTARAQLRAQPNGTLWLTLTTDSGITLTADGYVTVTIGRELTESVEWNPRYNGVWDLELNSPTTRFRFLAGAVRVSHEVTQNG